MAAAANSIEKATRKFRARQPEPARSSLEFLRDEGLLNLWIIHSGKCGLITGLRRPLCFGLALCFGERRIDPPTIFHTYCCYCHHHHDLLRRPPHLRPPGRLVDDGAPLRFVRCRCRSRGGIAVRRPADRRLHHRRCPRRFHGVRVAGRGEGERTTYTCMRSLAYMRLFRRCISRSSTAHARNREAHVQCTTRDSFRKTHMWLGHELLAGCWILHVLLSMSYL